MKTPPYGFGVDPEQSKTHFYVWIPSKEHSPPQVDTCERMTYLSNARQNIQIYERYSWTPNDEQVIDDNDRLRLEVSKHKWSLIKGAFMSEFNPRLKKDGLSTGKFPQSGGVPVERMFGKEMMVLLWAIEDCEPSFIPNAICNWNGLLPEERWWLYTMTNAATGEPHNKKGWRIALRFALCENAVIERQNRQLSFFDMEELKQ